MDVLAWLLDQQADGRWLLEDSHAASTLAVAFDEAPGQPSRWNTLRALRVLRWYDAVTARTAA